MHVLCGFTSSTVARRFRLAVNNAPRMKTSHAVERAPQPRGNPIAILTGYQPAAVAQLLGVGRPLLLSQSWAHDCGALISCTQMRTQPPRAVRH